MPENRLLETIIDTTEALIIVLDAEGRIALFNKACEHVSGYCFEEVRGRPFWEFLLLPEEAAGVRAVFSNLSAGQFPNQHKNHWISKSGGHSLIDWSNTAVTDESGRVIQVIGTGIDITSREHTDQILRDTLQWQKALLDSIPDAAWLKDTAGRYVEANQNFLMRHRIERADLLGRTDAEIWGEISNPITLEDRQVMSSRQPLHLVRPQYLNVAAGELRFLESNKTPVIDDHGNVIGMAGVSRDITERKLADNKQLKRDAELRTTLVREVNHRIKNNLQSVMALLHMHTVRHPETAPVIHKAIARLNAIATVHGMHSGAAAQEINLCNIVNALAGSIWGLHSGTPIEVQTSDGFVAVQVLPDETVPVALIINELIQNAVKHSSAANTSQPILIRLERIGPAIRISIFSPGDALPAAFDYERGAGLGTGLQLLKSLMPRSGAAIRFESTAAGVTVTLDLAPPILIAAKNGQNTKEAVKHG